MEREQCILWKESGWSLSQWEKGQWNIHISDELLSGSDNPNNPDAMPNQEGLRRVIEAGCRLYEKLTGTNLMKCYPPLDKDNL